MKILFICENYLPHYGGAEVVFKNLAERYVQKGHQVILLTHRLRNTSKKENIGGVFVKRINSFFSRYMFTFFALPQAIKLAKKSNLIQTTTFNGAFPAWLAGKITGKPVVITVHEVWVGKWKQVTNFGWLKRTLHELLERTIYSLPFDQYVCVSEATKNDLLKIRSVKKNKVKRIYNGFDDNSWNPTSFKDKDVQEIKNELGLKDKFVYFSWGRPGESKGFEYAIRAVPLIAEKIPNSVFLLMLGSVDKYKQKYQELINLIIKLNLHDKIKIIKSVPYQELGNYVKAANCVVVPSIAEGFGYTAVEATAMGVPVIASNAGSLPEVVSGKHLIFQSKNVADLAIKVIKAAQGEFLEKEVKKFYWEKSVKEYLQVYERVLANKRS